MTLTRNVWRLRVGHMLTDTGQHQSCLRNIPDNSKKEQRPLRSLAYTSLTREQLENQKVSQPERRAEIQPNALISSMKKVRPSGEMSPASQYGASQCQSQNEKPSLLAATPSAPSTKAQLLPRHQTLYRMFAGLSLTSGTKPRV